eukprot:6157975-Lingulodinium_polyedra.AAC.1
MASNRPPSCRTSTRVTAINFARLIMAWRRFFAVVGVGFSFSPSSRNSFFACWMWRIVDEYAFP